MIVGRKINLRAVRADDLDLLAEWTQTEPARRFLTTGLLSAAQWRDWCSRSMSDPNKVLLICQTRDGRDVGVVDLNINPVERTAEVTVNIADKSSAGVGFGIHALAMMISFGFKEMNLHRIEGRIMGINRHMMSIFSRMGAQIEVSARDCSFQGGRYIDIVHTSFLQTDPGKDLAQYAETMLGIDLVEFLD